MTPHSARAREFDERYLATPDPWGYDSSPYERDKYARTLSALPRPPIDRALEMGCSIGAFTESLAQRCTSVVGVDFSDEAVRLARARTAGLEGVRIERADLRVDMPEGRFDLVVCSEILYYWWRDEVIACLGRIERCLTPGGALVAVHWTGDDPAAPMDGPEAHRLLRANSGLTHIHSERHPGFVLDCFEAPE